MQIAHARPDPRLAAAIAAGADLDTQIMAAEQAVVDRDRRVQRRAHQIATRMTDHWPVTLGVTLVVAFLLGRALSPRHGPEPARRSAVRETLGSDAPIWRLVPLLWPLLPKELRARVPSGTVALLSTVAQTLTGGLRPGRKG